jgi:hypothetical protein
VARTVGGRVTDAVIKDLSYIGYLVEAKAIMGKIGVRRRPPKKKE